MLGTNVSKFITSLPEIIKNYVTGILYTSGKKNCSQIAKETNSNRKEIGKIFKAPTENTKILKAQLLTISDCIPKEDLKVLSIDDTLIKKIFGSMIEGRCLGYDSSLKLPFYGLTMVLAGVSWIHGFFPLDFSYWFSEEIMGTGYKKKWELALELIKETFKSTGKMIVVTDAFYFSIEFVKSLIELKIKFVMKAKSNIKISYNGVTAQLRHHPALKLYRNARKKTICAEYKGVKLYFTIEKLRMKNGEWGYRYLASNIKTTASEYIKIYNLRWPIEKCNRTSKQLCGIQDCQMQEIEKQEVHAFSVCLAYAQATYDKYVNGLSNTEAAIHNRRDAKSKKS